MESVAAFLGAILGSMLANLILKKESPKVEVIGEPGTGTMKDHVYVEVVKKKTVFRDKEIEQEELGTKPSR